MKNRFSGGNPNAQKVRLATGTTNGLGCVLAANEEVLFEGSDNGGNRLRTLAEDRRVRGADELRGLIGKLPNLAVFHVEAHRSDDGEGKFRKVVKQWASARESTLVQSIDFSTTTYLEEVETFPIGDRHTIQSSDLTDAVFLLPG